MAIDPLSSILALLDARGVASVSLLTGGDWALAFPAFNGVKFNAIIKGSCWLKVEGVEKPLYLQSGDCFLLLGGRTFLLASDLDIEPESAKSVFDAAPDGAARHGPFEDMLLVGGRIEIDPIDAELLVNALPPLVHIDSLSRNAGTIRWLLKHLADELTEVRPGKALAGNSLMQIMFVEALRAYLLSQDAPAISWLAALGDRRIGEALNRIHSQPEQGWTLKELAAAAGMSRSAFASRFKEMLNLAPLDYLLRWRMRLAAKRLRTSSTPIATIAFSSGYDTESGFSSAFRRVIGLSPAQYRRANRVLPET
jgi:AraC-like DNA-binding protein